SQNTHGGLLVKVRHLSLHQNTNDRSLQKGDSKEQHTSEEPKQGREHGQPPLRSDTKENRQAPRLTSRRGSSGRTSVKTGVLSGVPRRPLERRGRWYSSQALCGRRRSSGRCLRWSSRRHTHSARAARWSCSRAFVHEQKAGSQKPDRTSRSGC